MKILFHSKNDDKNYPGNIVVWTNNPDGAVILKCNIHHINLDVWYNSGHY